MNFIKGLREKHSLSIAVKEGLDTLPTAVCYFTMDGTIKLCNTAMYEIYRTFTGRDLQSFDELKAAMDDVSRKGDILREGNVFLLPDGRAMKYSEQGVMTDSGRHYTEAVFSDVTELQAKRKELELQSEEMKKMYADLKALSGRLLDITREQEILNMKERLHDQMNMGITAIRQILRQNGNSKENTEAITRFRRAILVLQEENNYPQDDMSEFIRDAKVSGVDVKISGKIPQDEKVSRADVKISEKLLWDEKTSSLLIALFREACVNAATHADAAVMNIAFEMADDLITIQITNNGKAPDKEITPRGGLLDLKKRIETAGGKLEITSLPEFILTVTLPVSADNGEEAAK